MNATIVTMQMALLIVVQCGFFLDTDLGVRN